MNEQFEQPFNFIFFFLIYKAYFNENMRLCAFDLLLVTLKTMEIVGWTDFHDTISETSSSNGLEINTTKSEFNPQKNFFTKKYFDEIWSECNILYSLYVKIVRRNLNRKKTNKLLLVLFVLLFFILSYRYSIETIFILRLFCFIYTLENITV